MRHGFPFIGIHMPIIHHYTSLGLHHGGMTRVHTRILVFHFIPHRVLTLYIYIYIIHIHMYYIILCIYTYMHTYTLHITHRHLRYMYTTLRYMYTILKYVYIVLYL